MNNIGIAQSGLLTAQWGLDTQAQNISNAGTSGYADAHASVLNQAPNKARPANTVLSHTLLRPGLVVGTGAAVGPTSVTFSQATAVTHVPSNVAIQGQGFFVVTSPNGHTAYTRAGAFTRNAHGTLELPDGSVSNPPIKIPPNTSYTIAPDGAVTSANGKTVFGHLKLATFTNPSGLTSVGGGLFQPSADSGGPVLTTPGQKGTGLLQSGALNASGVSMVRSLTDMIQAQSVYLANTDSLKTDQAVLRATDTL